MSESEIVDAELVDENSETESKIRPGRAVIKFIGTSSIRFVVSSAITTVVPVESNKERRKVFIASMLISGMINQKAKEYMDNELDEAVEFYHEVVAKVREITAEKHEDNTPNQ